MKFKLRSLLIALTLLVDRHQVAGQEMRFFRISGPTLTTIIAFQADGTLVWSNAQPDTNYIIQTASSLSGDSNWVNYIQVPTTNSVNTNRLIDFSPPAGMALIPAGTFTIGDAQNGGGDAPPASVTVSAFYMEVNLVSSNQWQSVYSWATNHGFSFANAGAAKAANHPVYNVDWYDCVKWCNARSQQAELAPVYYTDTNLTQVYTNGQVDAIYADWTATGYRLPTEAEWEKAARGGLSGQRFPWGNTISESLANYLGQTNYLTYDLGPNGYNTNFNSGGFPYTNPGGYFASNGYGINDMAGNLFEWCWDWYAMAPYPAGSPYLGGTDPRGPGSNHFYYARVLRGGVWHSTADFARCSYRNSYVPNSATIFFGFRCVRGF